MGCSTRHDGVGAWRPPRAPRSPSGPRASWPLATRLALLRRRARSVGRGRVSGVRRDGPAPPHCVGPLDAVCHVAFRGRSLGGLRASEAERPPAIAQSVAPGVWPNEAGHGRTGTYCAGRQDYKQIAGNIPCECNGPRRLLSPADEPSPRACEKALCELVKVAAVDPCIASPAAGALAQLSGYSGRPNLRRPMTTRARLRAGEQERRCAGGLNTGWAGGRQRRVGGLTDGGAGGRAV